MCIHNGLITRHHNNIHDLSVSLLRDACSNVCKEPTLQSLTGESMQHRLASIDNGARLDISAEGFWGHPYQCLVFDVRAFCLLSSTNRSQSFMACYRDNENACTPILVGMASPVLEILLLSNLVKFPFRTMDKRSY